MKKMITSAAANKILKGLEDEKRYWNEQEASGCIYVAAVGEEPVVPEYDYAAVSEKIDKIDCKVMHIKHALNLHNAQAEIRVGDKIMSVDEILIRMSQFNKRKVFLDRQRKRLPKSRNSTSTLRGAAPEYTYINFPLEQVKEDYERVSEEVIKLQMALDYFNQTIQFEIDER